MTAIHESLLAAASNVHNALSQVRVLLLVAHNSIHPQTCHSQVWLFAGTSLPATAGRMGFLSVESASCSPLAQCQRTNRVAHTVR